MGVKLGQKWAVKDGNLLASNQVGSRFFNKEFDFSRASNGTYVDRDGLLKTAELYNLISYSEDFSGYTNSNSTDEANATISPNGVKNATSFLEAATTGQHKLTTSISFDGSSTYTFSIYAKTNGRDLYIDTQNSNEWGGRAWFDLTEGTANSVLGSASIQDVGNGWYRCIVTGASILSGGNLIELLTSNGSSNSTTGDTTKGVYIYGAQLVEGTQPLAYQYTNGLQGLPRISFEDGVGHLLLEPQRTNNVPNSNNFNAWSASNGGTRELVNLSNPFGEDSIWKLGINGFNSGRLQYNLGGATANQIFSGYFKGTGDVVQLRLRNNQGEFLTLIFDADGVATFNSTNAVNNNYGIEEFGQGWYRVWLETTITGTSNFIQIYPNVTSGATSGTIYAYGIQAEIGTYPTSLIHTSGTAVSRLADVCNNSGSAQDFNSEGVLYVEASALENGLDGRITFSDGTIDNRVSIEWDANANTIKGFIGLYGNIDTTNYDQTVMNKVALAYNNSEARLFVNGTKVSTDLSLGAISGMNTLEFRNYTSGSPFYGKVRNLQVFTEALSDAELQQLTT
jgi:hypothetical protein